MRLALILSCLACASHGHRVGVQSSEHLRKPSASKALSMLLRAFDPAAGWQGTATGFSHSHGTHNLRHELARGHLREPFVLSNRASAPTMQEYNLNNYILPGPLKLTGNNILVKLLRTQDVTAGGLYLQEDKTEKPNEAVVVVVGPGKKHPKSGKLLPCPLKEGEVVILPNQAGESVLYQQMGHFIIDADTVLGSFEGGRIGVDTFRPLQDRIMIQLEQAATETETGILVAQNEESKLADQGEVIAVGPGRYSSDAAIVAPLVKKGEKLMFIPNAGSQINLENKKFRVVAEEDVIAKW